jgi:hypothetical protein
MEVAKKRGNKGGAMTAVQEVVTKWTNFHAFQATCCHSANVPYVGLWAPFLLTDQMWDNKDASRADLELNLMAFASWLFRCPGPILIACRNEDAISMVPSHSDAKTFTESMWEKWKNRMMHVQTISYLDEDTQNLAKRAYSSMVKVERVIAKKARRK